MKARATLFFAALPVVAAGAWLALRGDGPTLAPAASGVPSLAASTRASRAASSAHAPASPAAAVDAVRAAHGSARSSLLAEYGNARSWRALYDRLKSSPEGQTAEGLYVTYEILRKCATVPDRPWRRGGTNEKPVEQKRAEFLAGLAPNDPQRDRRIAAFEDIAVNRCAGFEGVTIRQADLDKILAQSAAAGDPKARAVAVEQEIWASRRGGHWYGTTLSDAQIDTLREATGTRDPEALVVAGRLLSNSWRDLTVRIGPDGVDVEPRAFYNAWQVLACSYGYPCDANSARLLNECAYNGHCEASSLPDYLYYYGSSPHESRLIAFYQGVLRNAVESGDWSQLTFVRGTRANNASRFVFAPGSR